MNPELLKDFTTTYTNAHTLEIYLKQQALFDQESGDNCTYVVIDRVTNSIMAYFSLKAGSVRLYHATNKDYIDLLPGIELSMFAVNSAYKNCLKQKGQNKSIGVGEYVFLRYVLPVVHNISKQIGVNIFYLFALPDEKLIHYYQQKLGFHIPQPLEIRYTKPYTPSFDEGCVFMYQMLKKRSC